MKIELTNDVESLIPLFEEWKNEQNNVGLGIHVDTDTVVQDVHKWLDNCGGTIITASVEDAMVGFLVLVTIPSEFGEQMWAAEKGWYVRPHIHHAGALLFKKAQLWAKENGCSHLVMTASYLASDVHDMVCRFYEVMNMKKFETSYIKELL
jgi:hypothetical protein